MLAGSYWSRIAAVVVLTWLLLSAAAGFAALHASGLGLRAPTPSTGKALVEGDSLCVVLQHDLPLLVPSWELTRLPCAPCASRCSPDVVANVSVWFLVTHSPAVVCLSLGTGRSTCEASDFRVSSQKLMGAACPGNRWHNGSSRTQRSPRHTVLKVVWFGSEVCSRENQN